MATAVLDLDIQNLPEEIHGLDRYATARVLIRLGSQPIGQAWLPLHQGHISWAELQDRLLNAVEGTLSQAWIDQYFDRQDSASPLLPPTTVAVCTRNRPDDLRRCLESLMNLPDDGQEFLIIDSAPDDDCSQAVVATFPKVRYIREHRPGLAAARNRAISEAESEIIAFTTDAAVVDTGWLRAATRNFADPLVACVTGLTMPLELETAAQEIFERCFPSERGFTRRVFDVSNHNPLDGNPLGAGVNMCIRRRMRYRVGPLSEAFGPATPTCSCDDTNWFTRVLAAGYRIIYEPAALVWQQQQRTEEELMDIARCYGTGLGAQLTHQLLVRHETGAIDMWLQSLFAYGIPRWLAAKFRDHDQLMANTMAAWLCGFLHGPQSYFAARQQLRIHGGDL